MRTVAIPVLIYEPFILLTGIKAVLSFLIFAVVAIVIQTVKGSA